ncbi:transglycosylase domain-containing protein [Leptospira sarikeiensis]|uniref:peptidoglycan glycosyltransferase n=1 Tax=Leptospira sarikeiensis TaxID=2484943 RepID=A0A4R9K4P0_9LEPT|nr:transglycosylase domain-containing protein [Leptospira sarikeiensis]TGL60488.1 hypothetical protein EHQ64_11655 [Leptospira sarikeiensis]
MLWFEFYLIPILFFILRLLPSNETYLKGEQSLSFYSSEMIAMNRFPTKEEETFTEWTPLSEYPENLKSTILELEDKRFYYSIGIDPIAILRASYQNYSQGRIVSGGSTIHQQLARIIFASRLSKNIYLRKLQEIVYAIYLNLRFDKDRILEAYLNRVPTKFNQSGFSVASKRILAKDVHFLTREDSISLVLLLRNPSMTRESFSKRYGSVRSNMCKECSMDISQIESGIFENSQSSSGSNGTAASHYIDWIRKEYPDLSGKFRSELSLNLTETIRGILAAELSYLKQFRANDGAVLVLRKSEEDGGILKLVSMVGSKEYREEISGQVNGTVALRNAGSTLKPFLYALAMDKFGYKPSTMLSDSEVSVKVDSESSFRPKNSDLSFWGRMTLREALALSRNTPAYRMVQKLGIDFFLRSLKEVGMTHLTKEPEYYGAGIALGVGESNLIQLSRVYSIFINEGKLMPVRLGRMENGDTVDFGSEKKVLSLRSAVQIKHILADKEIRRRVFGTRNFLDFPFAVAAKTGTSKDYRDSWTIGFTEDYIVAVWVGNFNGERTANISGAFGAGRIFQSVMRHLYKEKKHTFRYPSEFEERTYCRLSGSPAGENCLTYRELLPKSDPNQEICRLDHHKNFSELNLSLENVPSVLSPSEGETYIIDSNLPSKLQKIPVRILYPGEGQSEGYFYEIDEQGRRPFFADVEMTISLGKGAHRFAIYRDQDILEEFYFKVE